MCRNYRGISILPAAQKVYAYMLLERLRASTAHRLCYDQVGFRPGMSCADGVFAIRELVERRLEFTAELYMAFIDFERAFDFVPRDLLWALLAECGADRLVIRAIQGLYHGFRSAVRVDNDLTASFDVFIGVLQGCVLSPLLFIHYMDGVTRRLPLTDDLSGISRLAYADNLLLITTSCDDLQHLLDLLKNFCDEAELQVNLGKTKVMCARRSSLSATEMRCTYGGMPVEQVDEFKYLGFVLTSSNCTERPINARIQLAAASFADLREHF